MKWYLSLLLFLPLMLHAQLDKVSTLMTEEEFRQTFPNEIRATGFEGYWVSKRDTLLSFPGISKWWVNGNKVYEYNFTSDAFVGALESDKKCDRHLVKPAVLALDSLKMDFESFLGKSFSPERGYTIDDGQKKYYPGYQASWDLMGNCNVNLQLQSAKYSTRSENISLANHSQCDLVEMVISIRSQVDYFELNRDMDSTIRIHMKSWGVYVDTTEFIQSQPTFRSEMKPSSYHVYALGGDETDCYWRFTFIHDTLEAFEYHGSFRRGPGEKADTGAFNRARADTRELEKEGKKAFGMPETIEDKIPGTYPLNVTADNSHYNYLLLVWNVWGGHVWFNFEEWRRETPEFDVNVSYDRLKPKDNEK